MNLLQQDPKLAKLISSEEQRQRLTLNMIPSENVASAAVREAVGSVLMNKYSEGNIGRRYYEGNEEIDSIEQLTLKRVRDLFKLPDEWGANVQALSGSYANLAVYTATLKKGDKIMSMFLPDGGHLSHGWSYDPGAEHSPENMAYEPGSKQVHIVSKMFEVVQYKTDPQTRLLDYDALFEIAEKYQPDMIVTGGTAYPRDIDYNKMKQVADSVGAMYHADVAHEAGLIAAGSLNSPVGIADVVTMTTHKTLRAARGSIILGHQDLIKKVNSAVLPGMQGGPFNNNIAGICAGLQEALQPEFKDYASQVIANAKAFAQAMQSSNFDVVTDGVDKHLILIDLRNKDITGKQLSKALAKVGIICNMNTVPGETRSPRNPSGIRFGTPFLTTQGLTETHMKQIAKWMQDVAEIVIDQKDLGFADLMAYLGKNKQIQALADTVEGYCREHFVKV